MSKVPKSFVALAAIVGLSASSLALGTISAQAARPTVKEQAAHYALCLSLMFKNPAEHALQCSPGHYVDPTQQCCLLRRQLLTRRRATTPTTTCPVKEHGEHPNWPHKDEHKGKHKGHKGKDKPRGEGPSMVLSLMSPGMGHGDGEYGGHEGHDNHDFDCKPPRGHGDGEGNDHGSSDRWQRPGMATRPRQLTHGNRPMATTTATTTAMTMATTTGNDRRQLTTGNAPTATTTAMTMATTTVAWLRRRWLRRRWLRRRGPWLRRFRQLGQKEQCGRGISLSRPSMFN